MSDLFSPPASGSSPELTLGAVADHQERTTRTIAAATQTLALVPRVIFMLATLLTASLAASATPFLRCRMGILACLVYGSFGLFTAAFFALGLADHSYGAWADHALFVLFCCLAAQLGYACVRLYFPKRGGHIHRWSGGEPWPWLMRLYTLLLPRIVRGGSVHSVAIVAEPALLLLVAAVMAAVAPGEVRDGVVIPGLWTWPAAAAAGCLLHALSIRTREAWRMQVLLDHEHDQAGIAEALRDRSLASATREAEAFAAIAGAPLGAGGFGGVGGAGGLSSLLRRPVGEVVAEVAGRFSDRLRRMKGEAR